MARESFKPAGRDQRHMVKLPESADDLPERVLVDLDDKDPSNFTVVVKDDTPDDDKGRPTAWNGTSAADEDVEDLRGQSSKVQKRIDRLRAETHTERRAREAAERERDAAAQLVRDQAAEIERLRRVAETGTRALSDSMTAERESRIADATRRLEQAHADGDGAAIAKATADLSAANAELVQIKARAPRPADPNAPAPAAQPQPRPAAPATPAVAPNVQNWIDHNRGWFNKDATKTAKAMSLHYDLVARGVQPTSAEYTRELDKGMKAVYPDHQPFEQFDEGDDRGAAPQPRRTNAVDPGGRENGQATSTSAPPRTVELTQSEVSLANRLRIPLATYAAEKLKRLQSEKGGAV